MSHIDIHKHMTLHISVWKGQCVCVISMHRYMCMSIYLGALRTLCVCTCVCRCAQLYNKAYAVFFLCILDVLSPSIYSRRAHPPRWRSRKMLPWQCAQSIYMTHRMCVLGVLIPPIYSRHAHSTRWTSRVMRTWQCAQFTCTGSPNWRWLMRPNATRILCPFTGRVCSVIGVCVCVCERERERENVVYVRLENIKFNWIHVVCTCAWEREREREKERKGERETHTHTHTYTHTRMHTHAHTNAHTHARVFCVFGCWVYAMDACRESRRVTYACLE